MYYHPAVTNAVNAFIYRKYTNRYFNVNGWTEKEASIGEPPTPSSLGTAIPVPATSEKPSPSVSVTDRNNANTPKPVDRRPPPQRRGPTSTPLPARAPLASPGNYPSVRPVPLPMPMPPSPYTKQGMPLPQHLQGGARPQGMMYMQPQTQPRGMAGYYPGGSPPLVPPQQPLNTMPQSLPFFMNLPFQGSGGPTSSGGSMPFLGSYPGYIPGSSIPPKS